MQEINCNNTLKNNSNIGSKIFIKLKNPSGNYSKNPQSQV
jgi:hypothetical protein